MLETDVVDFAKGVWGWELVREMHSSAVIRDVGYRSSCRHRRVEHKSSNFCSVMAEMKMATISLCLEVEDCKLGERKSGHLAIEAYHSHEAEEERWRSPDFDKILQEGGYADNHPWVV